MWNQNAGSIPPSGRSPRCSSLMRAPLANGIGKYAFSPCDEPKPGFTDTSALLKQRTRAYDRQKKSPSGTSTDGVTSPSQ